MTIKYGLTLVLVLVSFSNLQFVTDNAVTGEESNYQKFEVQASTAGIKANLAASLPFANKGNQSVIESETPLNLRVLKPQTTETGKSALILILAIILAMFFVIRALVIIREVESLDINDK